MRKNVPMVGNVYTAREIYKELDLLDGPSMTLKVNGHSSPIQDSHVTVEQILSVPGFAETQWKFLRTTHEWVPCFIAVDDAAVLKCVDTELWMDCQAGNAFWVTPKDFPRSQD